jgi:hypothetical protein
MPVADFRRFRPGIQSHRSSLVAVDRDAGRPRTHTVAKIYKLVPETIERIKTIAQATATDRIVAAFSGPEKIA